MNVAIEANVVLTVRNKEPHKKDNIPVPVANSTRYIVCEKV